MKYSRVYLQQLNEDTFYIEVERIYMLITKNEKIFNEKINLPQFGDVNTKMTHKSIFYTFFKAFKTTVKFNMQRNGKEFYDREFDKEKAKLYNESVRNLTKDVMSVDYRLKRSIYESVVKKKIEFKIVKKRVKNKKSADKYAFYCDACCKGFMSENTMASHIKSIKHKNRITELGFEEKTLEEIIEEKNMNKYDVESEIGDKAIDDVDVEERCVDNNMSDESSKTTIHGSDDESQNIKSVTQQVKNMHLKKNKHKTPRKRREEPGKESFQLLVCSHCKNKFESRNKLFDHIRNNHI